MVRIDSYSGNGVEYAVKPKSFTARSLVGMTMGARKRAARLQYMLHTYEIGPIRREVLSVFAPCDAASHTYKRAWRMYRIGQRLRPCPGCHTCMPGVKGWHIDKVRGRFKMPTIAWSCDGSGVLPARQS